MGNAPFDATTPLALLQKICYEAPRPIREANPDVPENVARVVARLLEKAPAARHPTVPELLADLEAVIETLPEVEVRLLEESDPVLDGSPATTEGGAARPALRPAGRRPSSRSSTGWR